jgi:hypothetical protein
LCLASPAYVDNKPEKEAKHEDVALYSHTLHLLSEMILMTSAHLHQAKAQEA